MLFLRVILNSLSRFAGVGMLVFSVYYGIMHAPSKVYFGVLHIPSLLFVFVGLFGITLASYQFEVVMKLFWNVIFFSPTILRNRFNYIDKMLKDLAEVYYEKGAVVLLETVEKKRIRKLWRFMATKLEARLPIPDIQMLVQNEAKAYNESLFTQIRALQSLATVSPAVGMTGTILGLIKLLKDLSDFSALGSNMALAFITAFYGLIFGNFIFIPMVNRLNAAREELMQLISQGLFWLDMIDQRKPSDYLDSKSKKQITE